MIKQRLGEKGISSINTPTNDVYLVDTLTNDVHLVDATTEGGVVLTDTLSPHLDRGRSRYSRR